MQPQGVEHASGVITGTLTVTPTHQTTVSFVAQVDVPAVEGLRGSVTNKACVRPVGGTLADCVWSNDVANALSQAGSSGSCLPRYGEPEFILSTVVLMNDGSGRFTSLPIVLPAEPSAVPSAGTGTDIQPGDLNHDGYPDLLIAYAKHPPWDAGRYIQVLINDHDGTFRDETSARLPQSDNDDAWICELWLRDIDRDGDMDLLARHLDWQEPDPLLFLNDGSGYFSHQPLDFGVWYLYHTFLDLDGDGGHDLIYPHMDPSLHIYAIRDLGCPVFLPLVCRDYSTGRLSLDSTFSFDF